MSFHHLSLLFHLGVSIAQLTVPISRAWSNLDLGTEPVEVLPVVGVMFQLDDGG